MALVDAFKLCPVLERPRLLRKLSFLIDLGVPANFPDSRVPATIAMRAYTTYTDSVMNRVLSGLLQDNPLSSEDQAVVCIWLRQCCPLALTGSITSLPFPPDVSTPSYCWSAWFDHIGAFLAYGVPSSTSSLSDPDRARSEGGC